ncbi:MAG TPA: hypothetical protein VJR04_13085 [Terriglobales bacterium]|nr:hypothetical protein [Terriglobales bacterium]
MKRVYILLFVLVLAVTSVAQNTFEEQIAGHIENGKYINDFFHFQYSLSIGWNVAPDQTQKAFLESLKQGKPTCECRLQLMLVRLQPSAALPDIIVITSARSVSATGDGVADAIAYFRTLPQTNSLEVIRRTSLADVGGFTFVRQDVKVHGQDHYMSQMVRNINGQLLNFQVHTADERRMEAVSNDVLRAVHFSAPPYAATHSNMNRQSKGILKSGNRPCH